MSAASHIHFHSSDDRFCGSTIRPRQFTTDPNEVTCCACQARDTFTITEQGLAAIREFDAFNRGD